MGIVREEEKSRKSLWDKLILWKYLDKASLFSIIALLIISVVFVYSTTIYASVFSWGESPFAHTVKQFIFAVLGLILYFLIIRIPMSFYKKYWLQIAIVVTILMVIPLFFEGANGAKRWIRLGVGDFGFQPSEIAKITIVLIWSVAFTTEMSTFKERWRLLRRKKAPFIQYARRLVRSWGVPALITAILFILYRLQSDNGSLVISAALFLILLFASGGLPRRAINFFWGLVILGTTGLISFFLYLGSMDPEVLKKAGDSSYVIRRFVAWANPFADYADAGYHLSNSLIAISRGGLFGVGLGNGEQKKGYLTDGHTDFIMANILEEGGLFMVLIIYILYVTIILNGYKIARNAINGFSSLAATGITTLFFIQAFWNSAGIVGLLPLKGLTAPLISYGGTSLVIMLVALGLVQRINIETRMKKRKKESLYDNAK